MRQKCCRVKQVFKVLQTVALDRGESVYSIVARFIRLRYGHFSEAVCQKMVIDTLACNGWSQSEASHLPVGQLVKICTAN